MRLLKGLHAILLVVLVSCSYFSNAQAHIEPVATQIHPLRPHSSSSKTLFPGLDCLSWRLAVETDNLQHWSNVPQDCKDYVGHYMLGGQYRKDCLAVTMAAHDYVKNLTLNKDGKDIWVFDIDETTLSNVPYYARADVGFGAYAYNSTSFNAWVAEAKAPAVPATLNFYRRLLRLGVKIVFLTGTSVAYKEPRTRNMRNIGYHTWEMIIYKQANESGMTAQEYKSKHRTQLEKMGYRIIGNMGDQWSDILGPHPGLRTFKIPDPMYYIA